MRTAEMTVSWDVGGTSRTNRPDKNRTSEAVGNSHRAMVSYRWVRYATTPSGPALSILANPTRSNWTTLPTALADGGLTDSREVALGPAERAGHGLAGRKPLDDRCMRRTGLREVVPGIRKPEPALDCGDVDVEEVLEPDRRDLTADLGGRHDHASVERKRACAAPRHARVQERAGFPREGARDLDLDRVRHEPEPVRNRVHDRPVLGEEVLPGELDIGLADANREHGPLHGLGLDSPPRQRSERPEADVVPSFVSARRDARPHLGGREHDPLNPHPAVVAEVRRESAEPVVDELLPARVRDMVLAPDYVRAPEQVIVDRRDREVHERVDGRVDSRVEGRCQIRKAGKSRSAGSGASRSVRTRSEAPPSAYSPVSIPSKRARSSSTSRARHGQAFFACRSSRKRSFSHVQGPPAPLDQAPGVIVIDLQPVRLVHGLGDGALKPSDVLGHGPVGLGVDPLRVRVLIRRMYPAGHRTAGRRRRSGPPPGRARDGADRTGSGQTASRRRSRHRGAAEARPVARSGLADLEELGREHGEARRSLHQ